MKVAGVDRPRFQPSVRSGRVHIVLATVSLALERAGYALLARPSALWSAGAASCHPSFFVSNQDAPGVLPVFLAGSGVILGWLGRGLGSDRC
jgi:hypothetical protein